MLWKTLIKKITAEKRGFAILIVFIILSMGLNFALSLIGSVMETLDRFSSEGNTLVVASNASLEEIKKYGDVVDYAFYNKTYMIYNNENITVFEGYGEFKTLGIKSLEGNKAIVLGMNIPAGEKIKIGQNVYVVEHSYYYPFSKPLVLTTHRGSYLYVLMKVQNLKGLSSYLQSHTKILQFNTWKNGNAPWNEEINNMKNFLLSLFGIAIGTTLSIIFLLSIAHMYGEVKGIGIMKSIGLPDSFLTFLFTGGYFLLSSVGYLIGIFLGIIAGASYNDKLVSMPFSLNVPFLLVYNLAVYLVIIIFTILPFLYVKRIGIVRALRGGFSKISKVKYIVVLAILFFGILTPLGVSQQFMNERIDVPFDAMVMGNVSSLNIGEKGGYLYGVKVENLSTDAYFLNYNSMFNSTIVEGRWFSSQDEVVIGYAIAKKCNVGVGDTIKINIAGKWKEYKIVGISSSPMNNYQAVYLPKAKYIPEDVLFIKNVDNELIKNLKKEGYDVYTKDDIIANYHSEVALLNTVLTGIILSLIIISIFALFTLLYLDIKKNEKVYASLKAMGVPDSHVYKEFLPMLTLSSLIAIIVSIPLSIFIARKIHDIVMPSIVHPDIFIILVFFGLIIFFLFIGISYLLLRKIMKNMNIISILRE